MTDPDQRLQRARTAFVRQEFAAPIATILELTEILIEDGRRNEDTSLVSDLERIHSAGLLLREQLGRLVSLAMQDSLGAGDESAAISTTLRHDLRTPLNRLQATAENAMPGLAPGSAARSPIALPQAPAERRGREGA